MGCCGKAKDVLKKGANIAAGYTRLATDNLGVTKKYEFTDDRIRACHKCDEQTWLKKTEYLAYLAKHNIKVITEFTDLSKLPKLPKHKQGKNRRGLYCRSCKCFIFAKARVESEECLLGNWPKRLIKKAN